MREPVGSVPPLGDDRVQQVKTNVAPLPRSQAVVTVRPFPWLQTAQDLMKTHRTLSILVQATLCKTSTEQAQVGSLFHPMQPSLRMWAVPKTVNAAARADREARQREAAELRVRRAADLGLPWPKKPRGVGRPSDTFLWQEQLHKAVDRRLA